MNLKSIGALFCAIVLAACTHEPIEEPVNVSPEPSGDFDNVIMHAHDFVWAENPSTKTNLTIDDVNGAVFSWAEGEIVGICPDVGTQVRFPIVNGTGANTQTAKFTGGGWAVKGAHRYMAYYPFIPDMDLDKTSIPVDYTGQVQDGNSSTAHLGNFDFMAAASSAPNDGEINFDFDHMGSLLMLNLTVPKVGEYNTLTMSTRGHGNPFVTKGTVDITAASPEITATAWSNEFVVNLNNIITTTVNQNVVIYVLIPPVDMSGQRIYVNLRGNHADCETWFDRGNNKPFKPGSAYRPTMDHDMIGGDVIKLESGHQFNEDIKSLVNGEHFIYDKTDYRIKNISLEVGDNAIPSQYVHIDVSASDSPAPIYAYWKPETEELVIRTPSTKVYANEDASGMFNNLNKLAHIDMSSFDLAYTTSIEQLFMGCASLTSLDLSAWNTEKIENFVDLFRGCKSLTSLNISSFNIENAISLAGMFWGCESLTSLDLRHFKTSEKLCWLSDMFNGCNSLTSILFSQDFNTESVSFYYDMFLSCENLESLDLSMFNTSNGSDFQRMFHACGKLSNLTIDLSITDKTVALEGMFGGCSSLPAIDASNWDVSGVDNLNGVFLGCSSLGSIDVSSWNVSNAKSFDGLFDGCTGLTEIDLSTWNTNSAESFYLMFHGCSYLTNLVLSSGFVTNNVTNFRQMFDGCENLSSIDMSSFDTSAGTNFSGMFNNCHALSTINVVGFDTQSAIDISSMFAGCTNLSSLDLSSFNTSRVINMGGLFYQCSNLASITFGTSFDTHYCETFERMFSKSGVVELDLSFFNTSSANNMGGMFDGCSSLTRLNVSSFDTSHCGDLWDFVSGCSVLGELRFGPLFTNGLCESFAWGLAGSIESCSIYCTNDFKTAWLATDNIGIDNNRIVWRDYVTGNLL